MSKQLEKLSGIVDRANKAKKEIAPTAAKAVIEAVRKDDATGDLLQLIGILAGQGLSADELLIAIRNELSNE